MAESSTNIYVKPVPYTRGGIFKSASDVSNSDFKALESRLMGVPNIPDIPFAISDDDLYLVFLMSNHVTIRVPSYPVKYLHTHTTTVLASKYTTGDPSELEPENAIEIIQQAFANPDSTIKYSDLTCQCRGHTQLAVLEDYNLRMLLIRLVELDVTEEFKDQSGAQYLVSLVNYISYAHRLEITCCSKGASLQTSCVAYDSIDNKVHPLNSTPDFILKGTRGQSVGIGEMESSPYKQMVVAGLGHIGQPFVKYLVGICLTKSRTIELYLIENKLNVKLHCDEVYVGDISIKKITTEPHYLTKLEGLKKFMSKIASVLKFIIKDYEERIKDLDLKTNQAVITSPLVPRQSKRIRQS